MLEIIVEKRSTNGNIQIDSLKEVRKFFAKRAPILGKDQDIIVCYLSKDIRRTIGFFSSIEARNAAIDAIKRCASRTIILDYNTYFDAPLHDDTFADKILNANFRTFTLQRHIRQQIDNEHITQPMERDAFRSLGIMFIHGCLADNPFYIEDVDLYSALFSKTIWTPNRLSFFGISRFQFFKYLINKNNEKFNHSK